MAYAVVRTDKLHGTDQRAEIFSVEYRSGDTPAPAAIQNGNVVLLGNLKSGEREIYYASAVAANSPLNKVVLIASPEMMYDKFALDEFINPAGVPARAYSLVDHGMFGVTKEALAGASTPAVGDVVELAAGTKLNVVAAATGATAGSTIVGKIDAIETAGKYTYYVIRIETAPATAAAEATPDH